MEKSNLTEINNQPIATIQPVTDRYFGTDVVDNYRYMEDFSDRAVQEWVKAQADYTIETLAQLPGRQAFFDRMMELDASVPANVFGIVRLANGKIFYFKRKAQDDVSKLYMRDSIDGEEILLVDPDRFQQLKMNFFRTPAIGFLGDDYLNYFHCSPSHNGYLAIVEMNMLISSSNRCHIKPIKSTSLILAKFGQSASINPTSPLFWLLEG
jgi:hypothetical protein